MLINIGKNVKQWSSELSHLAGENPKCKIIRQYFIKEKMHILFDITVPQLGMRGHARGYLLLHHF